MPEEIKEKILKFLMVVPEEEMSISELQKLIGTFSYPTILKWVLILQAEGKIQVKDYGNIKLISLSNELKEQKEKKKDYGRKENK